MLIGKTITPELVVSSVRS